MKTLYDVLGAAITDTADTVKALYRKKAQETHPDRSGGNKEAFQQVQTAYDVLSDPERRARYDATGQFTGQVEDKRQTMLAQAASIVMQLIDSVDVKHTNLIKSAIAHVAQGSEVLRNTRRSHERMITTKQEVLARLVCDGDAVIKGMIEAAVRAHEDILAQIDGAIERNDELTELLNEYAYTVDPMPEPSLTARMQSGMYNNMGSWPFPHG